MLSRFDSHISNIRFPWEKAGGCIVPIGSFNCWKLDKQGEWKATCTLLYDLTSSTLPVMLPIYVMFMPYMGTHV
jgi:hypothetical protein